MLRSKPDQLYVRLNIILLSQHANHVSSGIIRHYVVAFRLFTFLPYWIPEERCIMQVAAVNSFPSGVYSIYHQRKLTWWPIIIILKIQIHSLFLAGFHDISWNRTMLKIKYSLGIFKKSFFTKKYPIYIYIYILSSKLIKWSRSCTLGYFIHFYDIIAYIYVYIYCRTIVVTCSSPLILSFMCFHNH